MTAPLADQKAAMGENQLHTYNRLHILAPFLDWLRYVKCITLLKEQKPFLKAEFLENASAATFL